MPSNETSMAVMTNATTHPELPNGTQESASVSFQELLKPYLKDIHSSTNQTQYDILLDGMQLITKVFHESYHDLDRSKKAHSDSVTSREDLEKIVTDTLEDYVQSNWKTLFEDDNTREAAVDALVDLLTDLRSNDATHHNLIEMSCKIPACSVTRWPKPDVSDNL